MRASTMVQLRRVSEPDLDWLAAVAADPELVGEHNWAGEPVDEAAYRAELGSRFAADGLHSPWRGSLLVVIADGTRVGDVSWRTERWGPSLKSRCLAFGINLLPDYRGRGLGTDAQRQLIGYLFETTDVHRIQSDTAVDNHAELATLSKIGMHREGVVRDAEHRAGRYHDHVVFSILRPEWQAGSGEG